ncbi:hypothetical protein [Aeromonas allosaccharophila]|uniref:hypothetical protein n=1 Tax=Aeromonas allosaccharophila TaxID=656 RepID=UPI002AE012CB|nr:hypothetical protein [Aeromonas allosaccharophila]
MELHGGGHGLDLPLTSKAKVIFAALIDIPVIKTDVVFGGRLGGGGSGLFAAYPITSSRGINLWSKAAIGRIETGFATLGANRVSLGSRIGTVTEHVTVQSGVSDAVRHTGSELVHMGKTGLKRVIWSGADNPIYRRHPREKLNTLREGVEPFELLFYGVFGDIIRVELDFTIKDAEVRTSGATFAAAMLANVVNGGLFV